MKEQSVNTAKCQFPNCNRHAEKTGYCIGHAGYSNFTPVNVPKGANRVADNRKELDKKYKKLVKDMAAMNNKCEIKSPVCTKIMEGLHHKQKRTPENMLDKNNLFRCCNACNGYIEGHSTWAKENGFTISRFKKKDAGVIIAEHDQEVKEIIIEKK